VHAGICSRGGSSPQQRKPRPTAIMSPAVGDQEARTADSRVRVNRTVDHRLPGASPALLLCQECDRGRRRQSRRWRPNRRRSLSPRRSPGRRRRTTAIDSTEGCSASARRGQARSSTLIRTSPAVPLRVAGEAALLTAPGIPQRLETGGAGRWRASRRPRRLPFNTCANASAYIGSLYGMRASRSQLSAGSAAGLGIHG
jgi:hypothetical protein